MLNDESCYDAVRARDARFDGTFYTAVSSTGIYCRPSCPSVTPRRDHVRFYATAAAAQQAGFRACKRCRPDVTPGSPEWNVRADVVGRAMRLVADGVVDRLGVGGLATMLGYSVRQLERLLLAEVGAPPLALARAQRTQVARTLLETTGLPITDVAFAAGFSSVRQFNATIRSVFALAPTDMRRRARRPGRAEPSGNTGTIRLRLPYRPPLDLEGLIGFLAARAIPGVEQATKHTYRRVLSLPHGQGVVSLAVPEAPGSGRASDHGAYVVCELDLDDLRDLGAAVARSRRLLDLDADPAAIGHVLGRDAMLGPLVALAPGRRVPGHVDPSELSVRAVLGQQVSVAAARALAGRLAARYGRPLARPVHGLTHAFPTPQALTTVDPGDLPMPAARQRALVALAGALATGAIRLDGGVDRDETAARLLALPGIGPWTVAYVRMRALGDPDAFLPSDLGVRRALESLGEAADPASAAALSERWRPWRAYAVQHLWAHLPPSPSATGTAAHARGMAGAADAALPSHHAIRGGSA